LILGLHDFNAIVGRLEKTKKHFISDNCMKTPSLALLNSLGLQNTAQKALLAAHMLKAATVSSPAVTISPAITGVVGKRAVPGYAGFAGFAGQTALLNTTGKLAGEVFPGRPAVAAVTASNGYGAVVAIPVLDPSPAYPAGTAIPSYAAVPARPAVVEVLPVTAATAVTAPEIKAIPGWSDAIEINKTASQIQIVAYLPVSTGPLLIGAPINGINSINEMTPAALQPMFWLDAKASITPESITSEPAKLEQYFYKQALALVAQVGSNSTIQNVNRLINGTTVSCKKLMLSFDVNAYDLTSESLQLSNVGSVVQQGS
jgi:hypothetical protein